MVKAKGINLAGGNAAEVQLDEAVFAVEVRKDILHRVIEWQRAKTHRGTHQTKTISMVSGTTKKPYAQKHTGRARQGSLRSPQMRGGARIFGPVVRSYAYSLPKKVRALGLRVALSAKQAEGKLFIAPDLSVKSAKTKEFANQLEKLGLSNVLFIDGPEVNPNLKKAISNLKYVDALPQQGANVYDIIRHDTLVLSQAALKHLSERLSK
ncbi:MAG: 50S ribosomal protein L4 [Proteobacteria bacterium]|nr:50S ribosomal protein L4 [Pseudomonadota bacterium]